MPFHRSSDSMSSSLLDIANLDLASTPNTLPPKIAEASAETGSAVQNAILTRQRARVVRDVHTEVFVQSFADRVLVLVTQLGRIGCLVRCSSFSVLGQEADGTLLQLQVNPPPAGIPSAFARNAADPSRSSLPRPDPSMAVLSLFGAAPSRHVALLHEMYAIQTAAIIFDSAASAGERESRPVMLGIALKRAQASTDGDSDDEDVSGISETERAVFGQVMEMVEECAGTG